MWRLTYLSNGYAAVIPLLESRCVVHAMDSTTDHRQLAEDVGTENQMYFLAVSRPAFEVAWSRLAGDQVCPIPQPRCVCLTWGSRHLGLTLAGRRTPQPIEPRTIKVRQGRRLHVAVAAGGVCRFDFADLCARDIGAPRACPPARLHRRWWLPPPNPSRGAGAADFGALAAAFHTVVINGLPQLSTVRHNEAQRFVVVRFLPYACDAFGVSSSMFGRLSGKRERFLKTLSVINNGL